MLAQYSFDLRRRLWNTVLGITWKIIMEIFRNIKKDAVQWQNVVCNSVSSLSGLLWSSDCWHPQTLQVESDQTPSTRFQKLPTQLNRFVLELVQVFPNISDVQRLGRCVPAFNHLDLTHPGRLNIMTSVFQTVQLLPDVCFPFQVLRSHLPSSREPSNRSSKAEMSSPSKTPVSIWPVMSSNSWSHDCLSLYDLWCPLTAGFCCIQVSVWNREDSHLLCVGAAVSRHPGQGNIQDFVDKS